MRVIAGRFRSRTIHSVKGEWLRPTADRTREFVFSWLGNLVEAARVLDLFAGTGSLGIEAISRGARAATFVDSSPAAYNLLRRNLESLGIEAALHRQEALTFLKMAARLQQRYDLIFCDPPYRYQDIGLILSQVQSGQLLESKGLFVYEASSRDKFSCPEPWRALKVKILGDTQIIFCGLSDDQENSDLSGLL